MSFALPDLGWDGWFESNFQMLQDQDLVCARVAVHHRGAYLVYGERGEWWAELSGKLRHSVKRRSELPAVGDWVALKQTESGTAPIVAVLERKTKFSRMEAGLGRHGPLNERVRTEEQILAANLDYVFVINALTEEFNVRRIERYVTMIWEGGATPVIVLNKSDLKDPAEAEADALSTAPSVDVFAVSASTGQGLDNLEAFMVRGKTIAMVGSSGVGKTSMVNALIGSQERAVQPTRKDDRGRHTTSYRELIVMDTGGMIIDTPGLRELSLWNSNEGIERTFDDVASLAAQCRFNDCRHATEPGCAVTQALGEGWLEPSRLNSYQKLKRELEFLERRQDPRLERDNRNRWKAITKEAKKKSRP